LPLTPKNGETREEWIQIFEELMASNYEPRPVRFRHIGGHPALDLANSLEWRFRLSGPKEQLCSYAHLLVFCENAGVLPEYVATYLARKIRPKSQDHILRYVIAMREAFAGFLYPSPLPNKDDDEYARFEMAQFLKNSVEQVDWIPTTRTATRAHWSWIHGMDVGAELPLSALAGRIAQLWRSADRKLIKRCRNLECQKAFLDKSRTGKREWCDMNRCGSAAKRKRFLATDIKIPTGN
jgi:predicted RNA-binding Zn ribbon-like protein